MDDKVNLTRQERGRGCHNSITMSHTDSEPALPPVDALLDELKSQPEEDRVNAVLSDGRYVRPGLVQPLVDLSLALRYENPTQMLHWASLAKTVADRLADVAVGDGSEGFDLRAQAWGYFGNALRVCGRLPEAEEAFTTADRLFHQGSRNPLLEARLKELMCSLHIYLRDFDRAISLSEEAGDIYAAMGDKHSLALSLAQGATAHLYRGEPEPAILLLNRAIPLLDAAKDPLSLLAASHNLVRCYIDLGMLDQALAIHRDIYELYKESEGTLIQLRFRWQEGQILRDLGLLAEAEEALIAARSGFQQRGLAYEAAVVSLDLAAVQTKLGLVAEARRTISEALSTFRALHIDRETLASLILAIRSFSV